MDKKINELEKFNVMTLGNSSVGKTSYILRYTEKTFEEVYLTTLGIDFKTKIIKLPNNQKYRIDYYDTAGQERYKSISLNAIKNTQGVILMYDITNKKSFDAITKWMKDIIEAKGQDFPIVLLGNKCDMEQERQVTKDEGEKLAQKYNLSFFETSNKTGKNIEEAGLELINKILDIREKTRKTLKDFEIIDENNDNVIKLDKNLLKKKKKQKCNC